MPKTLHLMTQRNQPYGSVRRCCENCGLMMVGRDAAFWKLHTWVDEEPFYKAQSTDDGTELVPCNQKQGGQA